MQFYEFVGGYLEFTFFCISNILFIVVMLKRLIKRESDSLKIEHTSYKTLNG